MTFLCSLRPITTWGTDMPYLNYLYPLDIYPKGGPIRSLDCELYYEPATPATFDEPADPGVLTVSSVKANKVEILDILSYATIQDIERCAEIAFDIMGDEPEGDYDE